MDNVHFGDFVYFVGVVGMVIGQSQSVLMEQVCRWKHSEGVLCICVRQPECFYHSRKRLLRLARRLVFLQRLASRERLSERLSEHRLNRNGVFGLRRREGIEWSWCVGFGLVWVGLGEIRKG